MMLKKLLLLYIFLPCLGFAQYPLQEDVSSVDGMISAFYDIVSGPAGEPRNWERDASLYAPGFQFAILQDEAGPAGFATPAQFAEMSKGIEQTGFFETELHRVTETFGNMVHVWSTYEFRTTKNGPVDGRGINSIQLYNDGNRWWILSASWQTETESFPIPEKYLPND